VEIPICFFFSGYGSMACCCGMAMNIWMQMMIPLFVFRLLMPDGKASDVRVREWVGWVGGWSSHRCLSRPRMGRETYAP
jgi:hypothetical protein